MTHKSFLSSAIIPSSTIKGVNLATFDSQTYNIRELFFRHFDVNSVSEFESFLLSNSIPNIVEEGHKVVRSSSFASVFNTILQALSLPFGKFAHQILPTFRVQLPGYKSVSFHTDELSSGHPFELVNIWMPLTKTNFYNSLHFFSYQQLFYLICCSFYQF